MKNIRIIFVALIIFTGISSCSQIDPPVPVGPIPSERQLAWHKMQYYAFIHFNMNTFTNMEWGLGGESPEQFNPSQLDTRQWARVAKEAGMKGIIITAKHHDGFCLWPTKTTEHSVKNSPWRDGKGDLVKELSEACKEYGLKFGVYLSPWDRNHEDYGRPEYVADFHEQLRELLTNYGDIFEVWFDGANGGSGYYGGSNETRKIDNKTYYEWDEVTNIVRELQPEAAIFSDGGPDIRWVGNEEGWANETHWSIMRRDEIHPGWPRYVELRTGHEDGTHWLPSEVDVSIRPGWYYHPSEDHQVKSLEHLIKIYYESVGRNSNLLLNLPVDNRGLVHEKDVEQLMRLREQLDKDFTLDLAKNQDVIASEVRGNSSNFDSNKVTDGDEETYWATNDGTTQASVTIQFEEPTAVNRILIQEYIPLGQRVQKFNVEAEVDGNWVEVANQTTIGYKRILRFDAVKASKLKVNILESKGPPTISNISCYHAPNLLTEPVIKRNKDGMVSFNLADKNIETFYTLNGTDPTKSSQKYKGPFLVDAPTTIKAIAVDPADQRTTSVTTQHFDVYKKDWKVVEVSSGIMEEATKLIDDNSKTFWATDKEGKQPGEVVIDLGKTHDLNGFTYWPIQERWSFGMVMEYEFFVSTDNRNWKRVSKGEFSNVVNNPIEQTIKFDATKGRFIKLRATKVAGDDPRASFAEIGVITSNK
ncbi:alpha-L-fucosidase [Flagellimonas sp. S3867]|uniref:alpha-L-fucosidase n=1 Tax=Flagellimonas sp. S3867 TaxID=2768063 RepID=UPI001684B994|nr:alpha-L-fucosidase [Flagellimonas sp. S3867]